MPHPATNATDGASETILAQAPYRIGAVTLLAHDLETLARFYRDALGLSEVSREPEAVRLGVGDAVLMVLRGDKAARPRIPEEAGLFHTAFLFPQRGDLGAWMRHAEGLGIELTGSADHLVSEAVYLDDPEGNGIEIYVDRPASEWQRAPDGTVVMRNERIDREGLAAAATRPWSGMPAGACVGHVHLQVGELEAAERFYAGLLGFDVMCRYPGALFLGSGGYHHQLAGNVWNSRGAPVRTDGTTGLAEVELVADGDTLTSLRARCGEAGMSLSEDDGTFLVRDPWGTHLRLRPAPVR